MKSQIVQAITRNRQGKGRNNPPTIPSQRKNPTEYTARPAVVVTLHAVQQRREEQRLRNAAAMHLVHRAAVRRS